MSWIIGLILAAVLSQSAAVPSTSPGAPINDGVGSSTATVLTSPLATGDPPSAADTSTQDDTAPWEVSQRSAGDLTVPPPPGPAPEATTGLPTDSEPAADDSEHTRDAKPRAKLQSTPGRHQPVETPQFRHVTTESGQSVSPTENIPISAINSRREIIKSGGKTGEGVATRIPTDIKPTTKIKDYMAGTTTTPVSEVSVEMLYDRTEETLTTHTASYFKVKRTTLSSRLAETDLSSTTQLSDIRDDITTNSPESVVPHTEGGSQPGPAMASDSSEFDLVSLTSPGSVPSGMSAPPVPPSPPSPASSPHPATASADTAGSTDTRLDPVHFPQLPEHGFSPESAALDPLSEAASSPSPVHPSTLSDEPTTPDAASMADTPAQGAGTERQPESGPEPEPEPEPVTGAETGAETEPETVTGPQFSAPGVDCAPELSPNAKLWRPGRDIKINFPLTIPEECTPAEQCSVTTVIDQRVTVQSSDTVTVRFVVSATGGAAPAAASLALRRADPGTTDCPAGHEAAPPALLVSANQRRRLGGHLLRPGVNHFFGRISLASEECFRLVVTVRSADCGDPQLPCAGRGHCVAHADQETFNCSCCSASSDSYCGVNDPCAGQPCVNGATCVADGSSYRCSCPEDRTGPSCSQPVASCGPCLNGGRCEMETDGDRTADSGAARCLCPAGYTGDWCQRRRRRQEAAPPTPGPCHSSTCLRGDCQAEGDTAVCLCPPGYRGQFCEIRDVCSSVPCQYGGTCHALANDSDFNCSCAAGFRGPVCQFRILPLCTVHPCSNGGTCLDEGTSYYCKCQHGFSGDHCEVPPGLIGHFDIHHMRSGMPVMAALSAGLFIVIAVIGCCYCRSVGLRQSLGRLCRPVGRCRFAARCCPRRTYKQFSEDQRKNLLEMGYSHTHQPIVEPIFADVDYSEAAEMPLIT